MCSPVSSLALGECNAIKSLEFGHLELTLTASWQFRSKLPISPFLDRLLSYCELGVSMSANALIRKLSIELWSPLIDTHDGCFA
jgi:hypothetical protein